MSGLASPQTEAEVSAPWRGTSPSLAPRWGRIFRARFAPPAARAVDRPGLFVTSSMSLPSIDPALYPSQLAEKVAGFKHAFAPFAVPEPEVFASAPLHYRLRAEFRMWHDGERVDYAMFDSADPKQPVAIEAFPVAVEPICALMPRLRERLQRDEILKRRLFQVDFLATLSGELMVTLVYHRPLDEQWEAAARALAADLRVQLIGRSRKQKIVLDRDWVLEESSSAAAAALQADRRQLHAPNGGVIVRCRWASAQAAGSRRPARALLRNGNFTVALASHFRRVLATEVSKSSVHAAHYNLAENGIDNVAKYESTTRSAAHSARARVPRLKDLDLNSYRFSTLFVDPPRSGLDDATVELARRFDRVLYISCNPQTLHDNVAALQDTHRIAAAAVFDQFPYTRHLECGLLLARR